MLPIQYFVEGIPPSQGSPDSKIGGAWQQTLKKAATAEIRLIPSGQRTVRRSHRVFSQATSQGPSNARCRQHHQARIGQFARSCLSERPESI